MNVVDLIIIGSVGLIALMGLKSGILRPVTGIGGFILGIMMAFQDSAGIAVVFAEYMDGTMLQRIAAFVSIVLAVAIVMRLVAWLIKKVLSELFLGWVDHAAGAVGGATLGILVAGTLVYLVGGTNIAPARDVLGASVLAPQISRASLVSPSAPWCSALAKGGTARGCTDFKGLASSTFGVDIDAKVKDMLGGQDVGTLINVVKGNLSGSLPEQLVQMTKSKSQ
jgi:uncharacterized membrane protein required for colicin V production